MIREDHDEAVLALTTEELETLAFILRVVKRETDDEDWSEDWFDSEGRPTFDSLHAKVLTEKTYDPEQVEDWGSIGPPT